MDRARKELDYDALEDNFKSAGDAADDQPRSTSESTRIMTASMGGALAWTGCSLLAAVYCTVRAGRLMGCLACFPLSSLILK